MFTAVLAYTTLFATPVLLLLGAILLSKFVSNNIQANCLKVQKQ